MDVEGITTYDRDHYLSLCHALHVLEESGLKTQDQRKAYAALRDAIREHRHRVPKSWWYLEDSA